MLLNLLAQLSPTASQLPPWPAGFDAQQLEVAGLQLVGLPGSQDETLQFPNYGFPGSIDSGLQASRGSLGLEYSFPRTRFFRLRGTRGRYTQGRAQN